VADETVGADDAHVVEDKHNGTRPESTRVVYLKDRPRSSNGLAWLIVLVVVALLVIWQLNNITAALHLNTGAIRDQTGATREQTGVLSGIQHAIESLVQAVRDGIARLSK
jgi:type II secretory pathway component PulK